MIRFIDCNTSIGRWNHPTYGGFVTASELRGALDYLQVDSAIVYHAQAHETHPVMGNARLMDELAGHKGLSPSWVLMPHYTGEMPEPAHLVAEMLERGVRVARLMPGYKGHRFSLEPWCAGPLLSELAAHKIPTLIDFMFFRRDDPDWHLLYQLCQSHPALPLILTNWAGLASRSFYPLCKVCPNLYLETSRYALFLGLEAFCTHVGSRQLLYGSGMPFVAAGVAMTTITHADICEEDKGAIAAGNLERLLNEVIV